MPGSTTNRGYPYPVDADPIDVAGDVQALAEAVDLDLLETFRLFGLRPSLNINGTWTGDKIFLIGKFELVTTDAAGMFTVTYAPHVYAANPVVLVNSAHDGGMFCNPTSMAVGGANIVARAAAGAILANTPFYVNWMAIGLLP